MLIGYARVSTPEQNVDHQIDALTRAGVEPANIYIDHASGSRASRPELDNTRDGLAAARARGRTGGRRRKLTPEQATHAQELYNGHHHTAQQISDLLNVPRSTINGYLNHTPNR